MNKNSGKRIKMSLCTEGIHFRKVSNLYKNMSHIGIKPKQNKLICLWDIKSLNDKLNCLKPVFIQIFGSCFIKWLYVHFVCTE